MILFNIATFYIKGVFQSIIILLHKYLIINYLHYNQQGGFRKIVD